jgi:hypothetical protein
MRASSPFDALASLTCSGQAPGPLVKTRAFGMTAQKRIRFKLIRCRRIGSIG